MDAIIECYKGKCGLPCSRHSFVCSGRQRGAWKTDYLPKGCSLTFNKTDERNLRTVLQYRLGGQAIEKTKFNTNTQKTEAVNKSYLRTNPRHITWSRNFAGRIHRSVHQLNCGKANSTLELLQAVDATPAPNSKVITAMKREQSREEYYRDYNKSLTTKQRRAHLRRDRYKLYDEKNAGTVPVTYSKGLTDPRLKLYKKTDHSYSKFS